MASRLPATYRALQLTEPGAVSNFMMKELPLVAPSANQLLVRVGACAVAFRDVLDRKGAFPFIRRPTVLGHEFAGTVVAVGEATDGRRKVGDHVVSLHWDQDAAWPSPLKKGGAVDTMFGLTADGGYAEYALVQPGSVVSAPDWLPATEAASVMSTYGTVWEGAVSRGGLCAGQNVLVTGASGGVGSSAVALARALGCHVTGVTTAKSKGEYLEQLGCHEVVVASAESAFKPPKPQDMVIECVGGPTFTSSLRSIAPGGKLVLLGNVENSKVSLPLGLCILNSISLIGSDSIKASSFENELLPFMKKNNLKPPSTEVRPLAEAGQAHTDLEERKVCGRLSLKVDASSADWPSVL